MFLAHLLLLFFVGLYKGKVHIRIASSVNLIGAVKPPLESSELCGTYVTEDDGILEGTQICWKPAFGQYLILYGTAKGEAQRMKICEIGYTFD